VEAVSPDGLLFSPEELSLLLGEPLFSVAEVLVSPDEPLFSLDELDPSPLLSLLGFPAGFEALLSLTYQPDPLKIIPAG
jgi:hypothetical protein